ncbi:MAG TPA: hypothetical protein VME47_03000 [Acetobacteraceae bacterium]|nr:hypothetical protein [Acetobacteraceae bacterium]
MSDEEAEATFLQIPWPDTNGKPVSPHCACPICYDNRRAGGAPRFRCKASFRGNALVGRTAA